MNDAPHRWSADREGKSPADDKLGRLNFAQRIAKELRGWHNKESLVVSLNGDWGSGKSTLINFVLHYLGEQAKMSGDSAPVIVRFNPWHWSGQDLLFEAFFGEIGDALGREKPGAKGSELEKKWKRFGALSGVGRATAQWAETGATAVAAASVAAGQPTVAAGASMSAGFARWCKGWFSASDEISQAAITAHNSAQTQTLSEVREDLKRLLEEMPAPLIVVIDDIDRLTKEQVRMLVQLVKANADFANVVFVLLFQKDIVAGALNEITCEKGRDFLKKIVQVELEVPAAPDHKMREIFGPGLKEIWDRVRMRWDIERQERWRRLFEDAVWPYFDTPRDVKRFLGVLDFYFEGHTDGDILAVNPIDLVLVETLRMFDPEAFDAVRKAFQKGRNTFIEILFGDKKAQAKFALSIDHLIAERSLSEREKKRLKALLYGLFPQAAEHGQDSSNHDAWDRDYRICHQRHFPKYFQLQDNPGDVPARFIAQFFDEKNDRVECRALVQAAINPINQGQFQATLERLWVMQVDLPPSRVEPVVGALLDMTDFLPDIKAGLEFCGGAERELTRLAHRLLQQIEDPVLRDTTFLRIVETSPALSGPVFLTGYLEPDEQRGHPRDQIISVRTIEAAKGILIPRIWEKTKVPAFWDLRLATLIIYRLKEWAGIEPVRAWLNEATQDKVVARKFFRHMLNEVHESGSRRTVTKYVLRAEELEKFINLEALRVRLEGQTLARIESVAVEKLSVALQRKTEGKPYAEIFVIAFDEDGNESVNSRDAIL